MTQGLILISKRYSDSAAKGEKKYVWCLDHFKEKATLKGGQRDAWLKGLVDPHRAERLSDRREWISGAETQGSMTSCVASRLYLRKKICDGQDRHEGGKKRGKSIKTTFHIKGSTEQGDDSSASLRIKALHGYHSWAIKQQGSQLQESSATLRELTLREKKKKFLFFFAEHLMILT